MYFFIGRGVPVSLIKGKTAITYHIENHLHKLQMITDN